MVVDKEIYQAVSIFSMDEPGNGSAWECYYSASSRTYELLKDGLFFYPTLSSEAGINLWRIFSFKKLWYHHFPPFRAPDLRPNLDRFAS